MAPRWNDRHERFRDLISARLDGPISVIAERQLARHLSRCAECRAVQNDYYRQRAEMRALRSMVAPRDLWARTSAALDREMARGARPSDSGGRRAPTGTVILTAAALGLALALGTSELNLTQPVQQDSPRSVLPTPFGVMPQRMNLLGSDANGLVLMRTQVDQVCPPSALSCIEGRDLAHQSISLPRDVVPMSVSISPNGERMAIAGTHSGRDGVLAVALAQFASEPPTDPSTIATRPPVPATDRPSTRSLPTADPGSPTADPATATPAAHPTELPEVSASPGATLATVAILDDVHLTGAPPAWSPDGAVLAFSAMPADGSHGPDVYIWREGDDMAQPLTADHGSHFASWADQRIVASRVVPGTEDESPTVLTVVIDVETGEERAVAADGLWLPVVSPLGELAVTWHGTLDFTEVRVRPLTGALYLADWQSIDPFASEDPDETTEEPTGEPSAEPAAEPSAEPAAEPSAEPAAEPTADASVEPNATTLPADEASPEPDEDEQTRPSLAGDPAEDEPSAEAAVMDLFVLEPWREPDADPVLEWQVRWSADGRVVGHWTSTAAGASWGQLSVVAISLADDGAVASDQILGPTLARRHFTLGIERVAWVGPAESLDGEIRIRTWGADGEGGLRMPALDLREVVPAF